MIYILYILILVILYCTTDMTNDAQRLIRDTRAELEAQARYVTEGKGQEPSARGMPSTTGKKSSIICDLWVSSYLGHGVQW